jgi:hypothetical protein
MMARVMEAAPDFPQQLDLFAHSRDVMLRNDLFEALLRHDAPASLRALMALRAEVPGDAIGAAALTLCRALDDADESPWPDLASATEAVAALGGEVGAAARRVLGSDATAWARPLWARAAGRAAGLAFRPESAQVHAAALWLQAQDWQAAARAVQTVASWRRIPAPLAWMTQARWHLEGPDAAWPLLAELAWLAPARYAEVAAALPDPALARLQRRFESDVDFGDLPAAWAWLPAWALTEQPLLAAPMAVAEPGCQTEAAQAWQLVQALLRLERQGRHREVVEHRRRLRELNAALFAAYMRTR